MTTPYDREELLRHVLLVDALRRNLGQLTAELQAARATFDAAHAPIIDLASETRAQLSEAEERLRALTVAAYTETGDKKPAPGVSVRVTTAFEYDREQAFQWAKQHGMALRLDDKAFEGIARVQDLNFVRRLEVPKATIATELPAGDVLALLPAVDLAASEPATLAAGDLRDDPFAEDDLSDLQEPAAVRDLPAGGDA